MAYPDVTYVQSFNKATNEISFGKQHPTENYVRTLNQDEYANIVNDAKAKDLTFMMSFQIASDETSYHAEVDGIYSIPHDNNEFWDKWFSSYKNFLKGQAQIAKNLGIEYFCIGHNLGTPTELPVTRWQDLINEIRGVFDRPTDIKLVYFSYTDLNTTPGYFELDNANGGSPSAFIDLFDYIGLNIYGLGPAENPNLEQLKIYWNELLAKVSSYPKPVIIQIGTPSTTKGTSESTFMEPGLDVSNITEDYTMDFYRQADVYEALFEKINGSATGNGNIMGIFSWGYHYLDDFHDAKRSGDMAMDKAASIRGKPAEAIMKYWKEKL